MNSLGEKIRTIRESKSILLRQVAAYLEIDTALISKIERGERRLTREQVVKLAKFYNATDEELLTLWLSDKLLDTIENDPFAMQGLNKAKNILKTLI
ncbi:MAG: helix-turn-helix domain-containing protein [Chitinophagales bacterium]|jgi:transcriptional regulator with XRE-family HTH domain|nr:helix-turn-helix domain-containing protein [Sphingobacteriales bacterium]